ncbi:tetratricopeptide repeat protein [Streptomyces sp. NPDC001340]
MGGVGKTALALEAAHRARAKGWFPGGTLFVDLRGYDENPVTADQAVLALLDALGVQGTDLPTTAARQYDVYREGLAGRARTLLILDNVSDPAQFRELLPGTDHHRVLITSRDRQDALPIRLVDLATLDPAESVALLTRALLDADERDERPRLEPGSLRQLASLCGHLPLALQIAAAMLRRRRHRSIASLVAEIEKAGDPTHVLDNGSPAVDLYGRSLVLRPVLVTSYRRLPPEQARLLRLLAVAPGEDTSTEAVAALMDLDEETALRALEDLAAAHLVTATPESAGHAVVLRWRLHDLLRAFGAGVVAGDVALREEGEAARERVLEFYYGWADAADDRLRWLPGMPEPERFARRGQALAWLEGERAALVAAVSWAKEGRHTDTAVRLSLCLAEYLHWRRFFDDLITVSQVSQEAAHRVGDRLGEAMAWHNLGAALQSVGRAEEAIDALARARDLFQAAKDRPSEAMAWNNLGLALRRSGRAGEAIDAHTRARDLSQAIKDRPSEAMAWHNLGAALKESGRAEEAIDAHTRARDLFQAAKDRPSEAMAWNDLGVSLAELGRAQEAIDAYRRALEAHLEFEDWYRAAQTLTNLAVAHEATDRPAEARTHYLRAADAFTRANAPSEAAQARTRAAQQPE